MNTPNTQSHGAPANNSPKPEKKPPQISITNWRPAERGNSLRGFFTAELPSGIILVDLALCEQNNKRWINLPAREYTGKDGKKHYANIIRFRTKEIEENFRRVVTDALDRHLFQLVQRDAI